MTFTVESGQTLGIIGSTGSGKTTLVQMIPRLYDTDEGEVFVDGVNVRDYSLKNLREGVGMVLQKNVLFSGSIMENLLWGDEKASTGEVRQAAKEAQADDCIARALLKKPKILILDDSTNAVDTATQAKIRESFTGTLKDTTKIIIAQRITSVMEADEILVLDEATSALDNETESAVMEAIDKLQGKKTMIIIAHRLTTIRNVDVIYEVGGGKVTEKSKEEVFS